MLARIDDLNKKYENWTPSSWWEGRTDADGEFIACGKCVGDENYEFDDENPEPCECEDSSVNESESKAPTSGYEPDMAQVQRHRLKVTVRFMQERRRRRWVREYNWVEEDLDRLITSIEALPEDLQDYTLPMVLVGTDVEALYPSLDTDKVA